jgi:hypothetical protein
MRKEEAIHTFTDPDMGLELQHGGLTAERALIAAGFFFIPSFPHFDERGYIVGCK